VNQGLPHDIFPPEAYALAPIYWLAILVACVVVCTLFYGIYVLVQRSGRSGSSLEKQSIYNRCRVAARERMGILKDNLPAEGTDPEIIRGLYFGNSLSLRRLLGEHFDLPLEAATYEETLKTMQQDKKIKKDQSLGVWSEYLSRCNAACYGRTQTDVEQLRQDCEDLLLWAGRLEGKSLEVHSIEGKGGDSV